MLTIGLILGLGSAVLLTRRIQEFLHFISPVDPVTFGAVTLLITSAALLAS